jgi:hypothetical protein
LDSFESNLEREYPFDRHFSDAVREVDYLRDGLAEVERFLKRLESAGKLEKYLQLVSSLNSLESDVAEYLRQVEASQFSLAWVVEEGDREPRVLCLYSRALAAETCGFSTCHELELKTYDRWGSRTRPITA